MPRAVAPRFRAARSAAAPRMLQLLREQGQFPAQYRAMIWEVLLRCPRNDPAFRGLAARGIHPSVGAGPARGGSGPARRLARLMSCLAHWSPVLGTSLERAGAYGSILVDVVPRQALQYPRRYIALLVQLAGWS